MSRYKVVLRAIVGLEGFRGLERFRRGWSGFGEGLECLEWFRDY